MAVDGDRRTPSLRVVGDIEIREFRSDDVDAILDVLRKALGETPLLKRTPDLWNWKHRDNPFGPSLVLVAEADSRIVGVRALMRWDLSTPSGEVLRCLRPVDTATDPDYGRRGIFRNLTMTAIESAKTRGFDLIFNTPNESSGPGYRKMGWSKIAPIGVMVRPLLRKGSTPDRESPPEPGDFFNADLPSVGDSLPNRDSSGLRTPRTDAYQVWRFSSHPTVRYRLIEKEDSFAVVRPNIRSGRKEIVVSELAGPNPARVVNETARVARGRYMAGWFSPGSPERVAALRGGMIPVPGMKALTLMALPLRELPIDITSIESWDFSLGDLELL